MLPPPEPTPVDARASTAPPADAPVSITQITVSPPPTDAAEKRRLRSRLLRLILENQHQRDDARRRGLSSRGAG